MRTAHRTTSKTASCFADFHSRGPWKSENGSKERRNVQPRVKIAAELAQPPRARRWDGLSRPFRLECHTERAPALSLARIEDHSLLAAIGIRLAMPGPVAWSIDAHLLGRKRINFSFRRGLITSRGRACIRPHKTAFPRIGCLSYPRMGRYGRSQHGARSDNESVLRDCQ